MLRASFGSWSGSHPRVPCVMPQGCVGDEGPVPAAALVQPEQPPLTRGQPSEPAHAEHTPLTPPKAPPALPFLGRCRTWGPWLGLCRQGALPQCCPCVLARSPAPTPSWPRPSAPPRHPAACQHLPTRLCRRTGRSPLPSHPREDPAAPPAQRHDQPHSQPHSTLPRHGPAASPGTSPSPRLASRARSPWHRGRLAARRRSAWMGCCCLSPADPW